MESVPNFHIEKAPTSIRVEDALRSVNNFPNRALPRNIKTLTLLGSIGESIAHLYSEGILQPQQIRNLSTPELSRTILLKTTSLDSSYPKLLLQQTDTVGIPRSKSEKRVSNTVEGARKALADNPDAKLVAIEHNHPYGTVPIPTPNDFDGILINPNINPERGTSSEIIVTEIGTFFLFRGENTPELNSVDEFADKMLLYSSQLDRQLKIDNFLYDQKTKERHIAETFIKICKDFDIQILFADPKTMEATRKTPDEMLELIRERI